MNAAASKTTFGYIPGHEAMHCSICHCSEKQGSLNVCAFKYYWVHNSAKYRTLIFCAIVYTEQTKNRQENLVEWQGCVFLL